METISDFADLEQRAAAALRTLASQVTTANHHEALDAVLRSTSAHLGMLHAPALVHDMACLFDLGAVAEARSIHAVLRETHAHDSALRTAAIDVLLHHRQQDLVQQWGVPMDELLARPVRTEAIWMNLTSRCNLRCVYCTVGKPGHVDEDLADASLEKILDFVRRNPGMEVNVGCFTETTSYGNWVEVFNRMMESGAKVNLLSNMAKQLSDAEVNMMARCNSLQTSIDTIDRDRLKEKRKGADIRTILYNLTRIRSRALQMGGAIPPLGWICVPRRETLDDMMDYVGAAVGFGVSQIIVNPLLHFADSEEKLGDFLDMSIEDLRLAFNKLEEARLFAEKHGITFNIGNRELMIERLNSPDHALPTDAARGEFDAVLGHVSMYTRQLPAGQTRLCTFPWRGIVFTEKGNALPCTVHGLPLASLEQSGSVEQSACSTDFNNWRRDLLNGKPPPACINCPIAPAGTTEQLVTIVKQMHRLT